MKTFKQCCDEIAKKYNTKPFDNFSHPVLSSPNYSWYEEAAELYANSKAAEAWENCKSKMKEESYIGLNHENNEDYEVMFNDFPNPYTKEI